MISAIVCSTDTRKLSKHRSWLESTAGVALEYVAVENQEGKALARVWNENAEKARGEILLFLHDDLFPLTPNWGKKLEALFAQPEPPVLAGLAGTRYLAAENPGWATAGRPYLLGRMLSLSPEGVPVAQFYSDPGEPRDAVAVDGCFMATSRAAFQSGPGFDGETFSAFHFYDMDFCMQARQRGRVVVCRDILAFHRSGGAFDEKWRYWREVFQKKWENALPASLEERPPVETGPIGFLNVPLEELWPQEEAAKLAALPENAPSSDLLERLEGTLRMYEVTPEFGELLSREKGRILHVGCGAGRLAGWKKSGAVVVGLDLEERAVRLARKVAGMKAHKLERRGDALPDALDEERFDLLLIENALEYVEMPERLFSLLLERLQPGGRVAVRLPNVAYWGVLYNLMGGVWRERPEGIQDSRTRHFFTLERGLRLFQEAGLEVERAQSRFIGENPPDAFLEKIGPVLPALGLDPDIFRTISSSYGYVLTGVRPG